eukprot:TRINITY_DN24312_c0_g2_i2.p3 TRINITY_DN24312_c0_g2~~TRINITY_DN24312_c0_g2_i2.p3  ORF type:complete len:310 (-),score=48.42 TRINITY_DN24312_c0_g2_i2:369-1298(-)
MSGGVSLQELQHNVQEYQRQVGEVELLLQQDPENEELQELRAQLMQVISETQELVKELLAQVKSTPLTNFLTPQTAKSSDPKIYNSIQPPTNVNLPASVAEQIRNAQIRAALSGQAPGQWAVGSRCYALWKEDGQWYPAVVKEYRSGPGKFLVEYEGYTNEDMRLLDPSCVRPIQDGKTEGYQGVAAPKKRKVEEEPAVVEMPKWLQVKEEDDEKTQTRKRKLLKSYKSKIRFQEMDMKQKQKQNSWKSFQKGKGGKRAVGYFTGKKKESIFKVPEELGGKVGVIGSGRVMTEYAPRARHDYNGELPQQ